MVEAKFNIISRNRNAGKVLGLLLVIFYSHEVQVCVVQCGGQRARPLNHKSRDRCSSVYIQ